MDSATAYNLGSVSGSGDASKVILQSTDVYSRSLSLLGHLPLGGGVLASTDSTSAFVYAESGAGAKLVVYDLQGAPGSGAVYPIKKTIQLGASANAAGDGPQPVVLTSSPGDHVVFIAGNAKILVVPVD